MGFLVVLGLGLGVFSAHAESPRLALLSPAWLDAKAKTAALLESDRYQRSLRSFLRNESEPEKLVARARIALDKQGVEYVQEVDDNGMPILVFSPTFNTKALNETAIDLLATANERLVYDPAALAELHSDGTIRKNGNHTDVCIDEDSVELNRVGAVVVHELAHGLTASPTNKGTRNYFWAWFNCEAQKRCLYEDSSEQTYASGISVDELQAYAVQIYFQILVLKYAHANGAKNFALLLKIVNIENQIDTAAQLATTLTTTIDRFLVDTRTLTFELFAMPGDRNINDVFLNRTPIEALTRLGDMSFGYFVTSVGDSEVAQTLHASQTKEAFFRRSLERLQATKTMAGDLKADFEQLAANVKNLDGTHLEDEKFLPVVVRVKALYDKTQSYEHGF